MGRTSRIGASCITVCDQRTKSPVHQGIKMNHNVFKKEVTLSHDSMYHMQTGKGQEEA